MSNERDTILKWLKEKRRAYEANLDPIIAGDMAGVARGYREHVLQHEGRFPFELLQNAHDACRDKKVRQGKVWFWWTDSALLIADNGSGFGLSNVEAICTYGTTTKLGDASTIGYKGIGFVSVYELTDGPEIHTHHGVAFGFDLREAEERNLSPMQLPLVLDTAQSQDSKLIARLQRDGAKTVVRLPFREPRQRESSFQSIFSIIRPEVLLFMPKLGSVAFTHDDRIHEWTCTDTRRTHGTGRVSTVGTDGTSDDWLIAKDSQRTPANVKELDGWADADELQAAVAIPWAKRAPRILDAALPVCAYYPTEESIGSPILLHGDFQVGTDRRHILGTRSNSPTEPVTEMLVGLVSALFASVAKERRSAAPGLLEMIRKVEQPSGTHARMLRRRLLTALGETRFVPSRGRGLKAATECRVLNPSDTSADGVLQAKAIDLVRRRSEYLDPENLSLDAITVAIDMGAQTESIHDFVQRLEPRGTDFKAALYTLVSFSEAALVNTSVLIRRLAKRPVVLDQNAKWRSPPEVVIGADHSHEVAELLNLSFAVVPEDAELLEFLTEGLKVRTLTTTTIIERIAEQLGPAEDLDDGNVRTHESLLHLLRALWASRKDEVQEALEGLGTKFLGGLAVATQTADRTEMKHRRLSDGVYFPTAWSGSDLLERLYGRFGDAEFLSGDLIDSAHGSRDAELFDLLGVSDRPRVRTVDSWVHKSHRQIHPEGDWFDFTDTAQRLLPFCENGHPRSDWTIRYHAIDRLEQLLSRPTADSSEALLEILADTVQMLNDSAWCSHKGHGRGNRRTVTPRYQDWMASNRAWIPHDEDFVAPVDCWRNLPTTGRLLLPPASKSLLEAKGITTADCRKPTAPHLVRALARIDRIDSTVDERLIPTVDWLIRELARSAATPRGREANIDHLAFLGHSREGRSWVQLLDEPVIWDLPCFDDAVSALEEPVLFDIEQTDLSPLVLLGTPEDPIHLASRCWPVDYYFRDGIMDEPTELLRRQQQGGLLLLADRHGIREYMAGVIGNMAILSGVGLEMLVAVPGSPLRLSTNVLLLVDHPDSFFCPKPSLTRRDAPSATLLVDSSVPEDAVRANAVEELVRLFPVSSRVQAAGELAHLLGMPSESWGRFISLTTSDIDAAVEELEASRNDAAPDEFREASESHLRLEPPDSSATTRVPTPPTVASPPLPTIDTDSVESVPQEAAPSTIRQTDEPQDTQRPPQGVESETEPPEREESTAFYVPDDETEWVTGPFSDEESEDRAVETSRTRSRQPASRANQRDHNHHSPFDDTGPGEPPEETDDQEAASLRIAEDILKDNLAATEIVDVHTQKLGWDISCVIDHRPHYVEVKSTRKDEGDFELTANEVRQLGLYGTDYIILFVTRIDGRRPDVRVIRSLHGSVSQFEPTKYRVQPWVWKRCHDETTEWFRPVDP